MPTPSYSNIGGRADHMPEILYEQSGQTLAATNPALPFDNVLETFAKGIAADQALTPVECAAYYRTYLLSYCRAAGREFPGLPHKETLEQFEELALTEVQGAK